MNITTIINDLDLLPSSVKTILSIYAHNHSLSHIDSKTIQLCCDAMDGKQETLGLALLPLAASYAVTPVSTFNVGAVAFDIAGNAYLGANFEFANIAINQTIHAEQSAIANAWAHQASELVLLVINYPPCGHCRQFINEVARADNFRIQLPDSEPYSLTDLLPNAFGPKDLGISQHILNTRPTRSPVTLSDNELVEVAKCACELSHAPYSNCNSGIALRYPDGELYIGCYAENAAFNPSLPPLQMALNSRRLTGKNWANIEEAILVEKTGSLSQRESTASLLKSVNSDIVLDYVPASR